MAGLKEIRRRLKSVNNTKKITSAMKLVSAAKLRKTQEAVMRSRAYTDALKGILTQLSEDGDFTHPMLETRETVKKIRILVVGAGRGLCGAFNTNVNRRVDALYRDLTRDFPGCEISSVLLGKKPSEHYRRIGRTYIESIENLVDDPGLWPTQQICQRLEAEFLRGEFDALYVVYTRFRSALSTVPTVERLLPLDKESLSEGASHVPSAVSTSVTLFEPDPAQVFNAIIPRIVRAIVRQATFDSKASEHASRMTAMDNATKNATDLIHTLTLKRNKLRQSGITSQLLDIVGGAEALK